MPLGRKGHTGPRRPTTGASIGGERKLGNEATQWLQMPAITGRQSNKISPRKTVRRDANPGSAARTYVLRNGVRRMHNPAAAVRWRGIRCREATTSFPLTFAIAINYHRVRNNTWRPPVHSDVRPNLSTGNAFAHPVGNCLAGNGLPASLRVRTATA